MNKVYVLVWKDGKGDFNITKVFGTEELLKYYIAEEELKVYDDEALNKVGYYVYERELE